MFLTIELLAFGIIALFSSVVALPPNQRPRGVTIEKRHISPDCPELTESDLLNLNLYNWSPDGQPADIWEDSLIYGASSIQPIATANRICNWKVTIQGPRGKSIGLIAKTHVKGSERLPEEEVEIFKRLGQAYAIGKHYQLEDDRVWYFVRRVRDEVPELKSTLSGLAFSSCVEDVTSLHEAIVATAWTQAELCGWLNIDISTDNIMASRRWIKGGRLQWNVQFVNYGNRVGRDGLPWPYGDRKASIEDATRRLAMDAFPIEELCPQRRSSELRAVDRFGRKKSGTI